MKILPTITGALAFTLSSQQGVSDKSTKPHSEISGVQ